MNWKNRLTNYNFWISIVSAVLLILQAFEFHLDIMYINEIATAVLGLLVVIGIINDPTKTSVKKENVNNKTNTESADMHNQFKAEINEDKTNVVEENNVEFYPDKNNNEVQEVENNTMLEEQSFPVDDQDEIDNESIENDIENFVNTISKNNEQEESGLEEVLKNLFNLLKNNEKIDNFIENLENFSKNSEISENFESEITENNSINLENLEPENSINETNVNTANQDLESSVDELMDANTENNKLESVETKELQKQEIPSCFNIVN